MCIAKDILCKDFFSFFLHLVVCCVSRFMAVICRSPLPSVFHCSFYSICFADNMRSISIFNLFLPQYALPFILPSVISRSKTSFLWKYPNHLCFRCQIIFSMFVLPLLFLIQSICYFDLPTDLLPIQTLKASNLFLLLIVKVKRPIVKTHTWNDLNIHVQYVISVPCRGVSLLHRNWIIRSRRMNAVRPSWRRWRRSHTNARRSLQRNSL